MLARFDNRDDAVSLCAKRPPLIMMGISVMYGAAFLAFDPRADEGAVMATVKNSSFRIMLLALAATLFTALLCAGGSALADEGAGTTAGPLAAGDLAEHEADGDSTGTGEASGAAYAKFDSGTGTLTFFRSANEYTTGQTETYLDNEDNTQTITFYADIETTDYSGSTSSFPKWRNEYGSLTRVVFEDEIVPISTAGWFYSLFYLESIEGMEKLDTSNVTNMWYMFGLCRKLSELDVSHMDVSKVTRFDSMFQDCKGLTELDVSSFDTSQAENMSSMFSGCTNLTQLDVAGFDTSHVKDMAYMFDSCIGLTELDLSSFDTSQVERTWAMFMWCENLTSLDLSHFNTSHVTDMRRTFQFCSSLTELNLSGWDTSNVTTMDYMFYGCSSFTSLDLSGFNTSSVQSMKHMFNGCYRLATLDISSFDTSEVTDMSGMFYGCAALTTLDLSGLDVSEVTDFSEMFANCHGMASLDLSGLDVSNAQTMGGMFQNCESLEFVNLSNLDLSNAANMSFMFSGCSSLSDIDLSGLGASSITDIRYMFSECSTLTSLDLSGLDTSGVTDMNHMFNGCSSLTSLNMSGWDTSNVKTMANMFYGCESLPSLDVSGFVTSSVTDMSAMFYECKGLTSLDLSSFNTSNVTSMGAMFYGCQFTTLDLSGFNTSEAMYMGQMFRNCDKLVELDVSNFDMSKVENMYGMLNGCTSLEAIKLGAKTQLNNAELPVREWQLASLSYTPVRYDALDGYDGANPGWYLQGYADLVIDGLADAVYTGEPITQTPMVSVGERALVENVDYTVSFADNTDAGTATVTVAGIGIWTGSADATFEIASKSIEPTLILSQETFAYNGSAQTPEVTVKDGENVLVAGDDYDVVFADGCKDVGTYPIAVTLKGNYSGSASSAFEIITNETAPTVTLSPAAFVFDGTEKAPQVTVHDGDGILIASEDYDVIFSDGCKDVGSYKATVTLKGGYSGSGEATFEIIAKEIEPTIVLSPSTFTYDGAAKTPEITVRDGEKVLVADEDYSVALPNDCKDAGAYDIEVALKGNYSGNASATFEIRPKETTPTVALMQTEYVYDGTEKAPNATVRDGAVTLAKGVDYDVAYSANTNAGTASVKVTLKGNYAGTGSASFAIVKAANTMSAKGRTATVKHSKAKKKAQTVKAAKAFTVKKAQGKVTYKVVKWGKNAKKYVKVSKAGKVTVKKGARKGTYTLKIKVTAAGNANYEAKSKTVTLKVRVK